MSPNLEFTANRNELPVKKSKRKSPSKARVKAKTPVRAKTANKSKASEAERAGQEGVANSRPQARGQEVRFREEGSAA